MSLLLHAISPPDASVGPRSGLRGNPLVRVEASGLTAWATMFDEKPDQLTRHDLLAHHEVVSEIDQAHDACLPARLPTWLATTEQLQDLLARRQAELEASLARVHGRVELAVIATWAAPDDLPEEPQVATPGTRYLLQRRLAIEGSDRRRERAHQLADELERLSQPELVEMRREVSPSRAVALSAALLVPRASAPAVKARLGTAAQDVRILVNGPWPPYTFAEVG